MDFLNAASKLPLGFIWKGFQIYFEDVPYDT